MRLVCRGGSVTIAEIFFFPLGAQVVIMILIFVTLAAFNFSKGNMKKRIYCMQKNLFFSKFRF